jgi:hypothetical protein
VGLSDPLLGIRGAATSLIASTARPTMPLLGSLTGAFGLELFTGTRDVFFAALSFLLGFFALFFTLIFFLAAFLGGFFAPDFLAAFFAFLAMMHVLFPLGNQLAVAA